MRKSLLAGFLAATLLVGCSSANKDNSLANADAAAPVATSASNGSATVTDAGVQLYPGKAKADAPKVVIFTDFQCPACKQLEYYFGDKLVELAKTGDIELRMVTLTFMDPVLKNTESEQASIAALCTIGSGSYPEAYQTIYKNQPKNEGDPFDGVFLNEGLPKALNFTAEQTSAYQKCR
ncbi:MAG: DsbA family protein, partial [Propionibacteriaceae bacterium]